MHRFSDAEKDAIHTAALQYAAANDLPLDDLSWLQGHAGAHPAHAPATMVIVLDHPVPMHPGPHMQPPCPEGRAALRM